MQNWDRGLDNCSNPSVVKKLDISGVLGGSGSQIQYRTEMLEAACVAIVRIEQLDGQASGALELLAEALDDTIVVWNQVCVCVCFGGEPGIVSTTAPWKQAHKAPLPLVVCTSLWPDPDSLGKPCVLFDWRNRSRRTGKKANGPGRCRCSP